MKNRYGPPFYIAFVLAGFDQTYPWAFAMPRVVRWEPLGSAGEAEAKRLDQMNLWRRVATARWLRP
jgi:hypothetical protein